MATVLLDNESQALIRQKVDAGLYRDETQVVREALRLLDRRDRSMQRLRAEIAIADDQIERGALIDYTPELLDELSREAEEDVRLGKPIKDAVQP